ncbi:MAG TPA: serine/threonine-protein kinase [Acidimicrobiales bacterium]|nr:serine/threonine-protein kinase [Acidimicrobiales bacterium]
MSGSGSEASGRVVAGRYRLESVLGRGGMGVVWRASDTLIERTVALKELRPPAGEESSSFVERALREARNAGRLNHPAIVAVHDVIAPTGDDPVVYIVMEYVDAPSLAEVIDRDGPPLPPARAAAMGLGILDALTVAHTMGIVHRDIKPHNVLVPGDDKVKLTDFGIALAAEDSRLTRSGVMGTHAYLAPECFDDGQVGPATDLWALGATLFHSVAGQAPFERPTTTATLRAILFEDPPAPPCGPPLADVITGLLTRTVERRLTGGAARELLEQAVMTAPTVEAPPPANPGQAPWAAQATTHHQRPTPPPPHTTHPGGPPPAFVTAQHPSSAQLPPPRPPATGPAHGPSPARPPGQPGILGGRTLGVLLVVVSALVVVYFTTLADDGEGGSGSGSGSGSGQANGLPTGTDPDLPGGGGTVEGALAQEFLDAVNSGDEDTAIGTLCAERGHPEDITDAITRDASLEIDPTTVETESGTSFLASLVGTVDGVPIEDAYLSVLPRIEDETDWCVYRFDLGEDPEPSGQ